MTEAQLKQEVFINCNWTMNMEQRRKLSDIMYELNELCNQMRCSFYGIFEDWVNELCDDDITKEVLSIGQEMD